MKILTILGARPQFIKHSVVQKRFKEHGIEEVLLHTGQHFDASMSEIFFKELEMREPDIFLEIKERNSLLQLSSMLVQMHKALEKKNFDYVLVYGDTTSTLAGSLFAKEMKMSLVHIEAGLRSGDLGMPEERNRIISDQLADLLFAPTQKAKENLVAENVSGEIIVIGDVMKDSFLHFLPKSKIPQGVQIPQEFILCTLHRQSNVDNRERLRFLFEGLSKVTKEIPIIFPIHPRTQKRIEEFGLTFPSSIIFIPPQGYLQTLWLLEHCMCVFTDSGGLQKEAFFAKKRCLILRNASEWSEIVQENAGILLGDCTIEEAYARLKTLGDFEGNLYGDGKSIEILIKKLIYTKQG